MGLLLLLLLAGDDVVFGIELVPFPLVSLELIFPRHLEFDLPDAPQVTQIHEMHGNVTQDLLAIYSQSFCMRWFRVRNPWE